MRSFVSSGVPLIICIIFSLILAVLVTMIVPRNVERVRETIEKGPGKSFLIGFVASILFLPLFLLLCITIIGLPVALIVLPIIYFVVEIMGFAGISLWVGRKLQRGSGSILPSPAAKVAVGALILELPLIAAWVFTMALSDHRFDHRYSRRDYPLRGNGFRHGGCDLESPGKTARYLRARSMPTPA
jgi:hypothetical protein